MSFILDALKKSETERQQQGAAEFSSIPVVADKSRAPKWLWIVGVLLTVNVIVLTVILLRNDTPSITPVTVSPDAAPRIPGSAPTASMTPVAEPASDESAPVELTFSEQVAAAQIARPIIEAQAKTESSRPAATINRSTPAATTAYFRTFDEARVQGLFQMTDLHLDIHVFGETPADRFVFINMKKYRENLKLVEGPTVREIRPDGVVLEYQGTTFLLPRD
jgi:general secretion pathway protein B